MDRLMLPYVFIFIYCNGILLSITDEQTFIDLVDLEGFIKCCRQGDKM